MEPIIDPGFEIESSRKLLLGEVLARNARKWPEQEATIFREKRITNREFDQRVNKRANAMLLRGIKKGEAVGLLMANSYEMPEIFFAAARIGAISVPVNIRLSPREIIYILNNAEVKLLFLGSSFREMIGRIKADLPLIQDYILTGRLSEKGLKSYEDFLAEGPGLRPEVRLDDDDTVFIIYTAGTTGKPKGAELTHKNLILNALTIHLESFSAEPRRANLPGLPPRVISITPFFHIAGILSVTKNILTSTPMIIIDFDPVELLKAIEKERATYLFLVPAMWQMVMNHPAFGNYDVSSLRIAAYGADITRNSLKEKILESFPNAGLYEAFGQTEMTATAVCMKHQDALRKEGSVGQPLFNVEVRVVDDMMNEVGVNEVGEIVYRGPGLFKGYYKNPEETKKAFEGGWFHSGDLVRRDEEGFIYVVDRKKDMIVSGGENIYSAEVEAVLLTHPKIDEAAVVGIPDPKWGETVKAFVVLTPGREGTAEEIIDFCVEHLARFKRPKIVEFIPRLPRSATGKVLKRELRSGRKEESAHN